MQRLDVAGGEAGFGLEVVECLAQKARRTASAVVDAIADFGCNHLHHGADQRARGVVLAAVAPRIAHVFNLGFVQVRQLVFFRLRPEAQFVNVVDDLAEVVAALDLVLNLAEDLPDFVFDGVGAAGLLLEAVQVGEKLTVHEVTQIIAGHGLVVVELACLP